MICATAREAPVTPPFAGITAATLNKPKSSLSVIYSLGVAAGVKTLFTKFALFRILGKGDFRGFASSLGVWLLTFPALVMLPWDGIPRSIIVSDI
ncbi:MAG: hypothetical protein RMK66_06400 [Candidatus Caldarchaeum sp.]|nr:hypothetical protein [Candidatus Caldarchaeum sp.]